MDLKNENVQKMFKTELPGGMNLKDVDLKVDLRRETEPEQDSTVSKLEREQFLNKYFSAKKKYGMH